MKQNKCNLCKSTENRLYVRLGGREIVKCSNCGFIFDDSQTTLPELKEKYEREDAYTRNFLISEDKVEHYLQDYYQDQITLIEKEVPAGTWLDIGCANGQFLCIMKQKGWKVLGVDISAESARLAQERFGIKVFCGDLLEAGFSPQQFDVISLWGTIEHMINPQEEIMEASRLLRTGGIFAVSTHNEDWYLTRIIIGLYKIFPRLLKKYIELMFDKEHLVFFSVRTLEKLLSDCGLKVISVTYEQPISFKYELGKFPLLVRIAANLLSLSDKLFRNGRKVIFICRRMPAAIRK